MALVILVRHGQTDENVSGKISGQGAVPLNARGQEQARLAAEVLAPLGVTRLLSSPVARARQTAEVIAQRLDMSIEEVLNLHEVDYGDWEGSFFQTQRTHPAARAVFHDPVNAVFPNGESLPNVQRRGVEAVEAARRREPEGVIAAVSHGDVIRTTMAHYLNMPFNDYRRLNLDNGALSILELHDDDWVRVKAFNFVPQAGKEWLKSDYAAWQRIKQLVPASNGVSRGGD